MRGLPDQLVVDQISGDAEGDILCDAAVGQVDALGHMRDMRLPGALILSGDDLIIHLQGAFGGL